MSLFGTIMSKIFGTSAQAAPAGGGSGALDFAQWKPTMVIVVG